MCVKFEKNPERTYGLEFIEGLWAEKLGLLAVLVNIATIIVSAVWCAYGGVLQTVFTVMSFVITAAAADIALLALYFQASETAHEITAMTDSISDTIADLIALCHTHRVLWI